jgi:hypothetical protein
MRRAARVRVPTEDAAKRRVHVQGTQRRGGHRPREAAMGNREPSRGVARALSHLDAWEMGLRR